MNFNNFLKTIVDKRVLKYPDTEEFKELIDELDKFTKDKFVRKGSTIERGIKYITFNCTTKAEKLYDKKKAKINKKQ